MFAHLADDKIRFISKMVERRSAGKGEVIVHAGTEANHIYFILTGKVKVVLCKHEGREFIVSFLKEGECFGEMGTIDNFPHSANVIATRKCELLMLGKEDFNLIVSKNSEIAQHLLRCFSHRMRAVIRKLDQLTNLDVYGRIAHLILDCSDFVGDQRIFRYPVSKSELGNMVGASREMVTRVLKDLEREGFIKIEGDKLVVLIK